MSYYDVSGITEYVEKAGSALSAAKNILDDPALPEVTGLVLQLHQLEQKPARPGQPKPPTVPGIGLSKVVKPLRYYVKVKKQPILGYAILAGIFLLPFTAGYLIGKK